MAKRSKASTVKTNGSGKPRSAPLPGMEDRGITALDNIAAEYAEIRDKRMELTRDEVTLKATALKLMKKHGKTLYKHEGVEIVLEPGEENIKVKVKKVKEDGEDDETGERVSMSGGVSAEG